MTHSTAHAMEPPARGRLAPWPPALLLGLAFCACAAPPPARVDAPFGELRAATPELATDFAERADRTRLAVLATIPGLAARETRVWVHPDEEFRRRTRNPTTHGVTTFFWYSRVPRIQTGESHFEPIVAHEWVHALIGPTWSKLPAAVEEGLANEAMFAFAPEGTRSSMRSRHLRSLLKSREHEFRLSFDTGAGHRDFGKLNVTWPDGSEELSEPFEIEHVLSIAGPGRGGSQATYSSLPMHAVGTLLIEAILARSDGSLQPLHDACAQQESDGPVSVEVLLDLAGFESPAAFRRWIEEQSTISMLERILIEPGFFIELRSSLQGKLDRSIDPLEFLTDLQPSFDFEDEDDVLLSDWPHLQRLVIENWPAPGE